MLVDALIYYHQQLLTAPVCEPILSASISALTLQQEAPLTATLHFLRDFLSYGTDHPNSSSFDGRSQDPVPSNSPQIQQAVKRLVALQGEVLVQRILTGMMFHFPRDCFPDASGVLLVLFEIMPQEVAIWVKGTIGMLPAGTVRAAEGDRLMTSIGQKIQAGETRKIRVLMQGASFFSPRLFYPSYLYRSAIDAFPEQISQTPTAGETLRPEKGWAVWRPRVFALADSLAFPSLSHYVQAEIYNECGCSDE